MKIAAITAHADDVVYGAGGLLLQHREEELLLVCVTSYQQGEASDLARELGAELRCLGLEFGRVAPDREKARPALLDLLIQFEPDYIVTHAAGDYKSDHVASGQLALDCAADVPLLGFHATPFLRFPVPGTTFRFEPDFYLDISESLRKKLDLAKIFLRGLTDLYNEELAEWEIMSRAHAFGSGVGPVVRYAEAYETIFKIPFKRLPPRNRSSEHLFQRSKEHYRSQMPGTYEKKW